MLIAFDVLRLVASWIKASGERIRHASFCQQLHNGSFLERLLLQELFKSVETILYKI